MGKELINALKRLLSWLLGISIFLVVFMVGLLIINQNPAMMISEEKEDKPEPLIHSDLVKDGIHVATGLVAKEGYETVIANCTNCHAADLVIQNRGDRAHWESLIKWMQATQGLWDLGKNEEIIVSYLSENYSAEQKGRRANLSGIEWYELKK
ncbi:hypothetical protein KZP23_00995 [Echinicola marina]|uniref:hypothetical protein n=1 Tax=Echinicola marina TaxID=2859768 RepID=UPI001CF6DA0B|nr:hypothetical protein [Echinicola marina]UCS93648.1 hypothetical protein KZP23_00995 [Echinicola marina]